MKQKPQNLSKAKILCLSPKQSGLTLIEVLVALAILAVAFMAVIITYNDSIRTTRYINQKTYASWVALDVLARIRAGFLDAPFAPKESSGQQSAFKQTWYWKASQESTYNQHTFQINIVIGDTPDNALIRFTAYRSEWEHE